MDLNEKDIARFDALLDGQLSSSERKELLNDLRSDNKLQEAFNEHKQLREAFQGHGREVLKSRFDGLTAAIPMSEVQNYRPSGQRGWWNLFKGLFAVAALAAIGFVSFDLLSNKDMEGAAPVTSPSEYTLPTSGEGAASSSEEPQRKNPVRKTQQVIVDTVYHTVIVSGDEKEIERLMQEKVSELEIEDPESAIIIKKDGSNYELQD